MKNLACFFISLSKDFRNRDMFLFPYYMGRVKGYKVTFYFHGKEGDKPFEEKGVQFVPLFYRGGYDCFSISSEWYYAYYLFRHAKEIDCLVRFHYSIPTILLAFIYKLLNPKGIFCIKGDGLGLWNSLFRIEPQFPGQKRRNQDSLIVKMKNGLIRSMLNLGIHYSDLATVETLKDYQYLSNQSIFKKYPQKLVRMLNGIDEEAITKCGIQELAFEQKENWIILVGYHGSWAKNTLMSLRSLANLDLKDWQVFYIGPTTKEFENTIQDFYNSNPNLTETVHFVGAIYDQAKLWSYYNRAKVFVHTSLVESYGIVLAEAYRFGNYILSTDVGIASEFINRGYGCLLKQNDSDSLRAHLERIVGGELDLASLYDKREFIPISWEDEVKKLKVADNKAYETINHYNQ